MKRSCDVVGLLDHMFALPSSDLVASKFRASQLQSVDCNIKRRSC